MRRAINGVAADADARALADAAGRELPDRFIGQRAAARNDADVAPFVDVTRSDARCGSRRGCPLPSPASRFPGSWDR